MKCCVCGHDITDIATHPYARLCIKCRSEHADSNRKTYLKYRETMEYCLKDMKYPDDVYTAELEEKYSEMPAWSSFSKAGRLSIIGRCLVFMGYKRVNKRYSGHKYSKIN